MFIVLNPLFQDSIWRTYVNKYVAQTKSSIKKTGKTTSEIQPDFYIKTAKKQCSTNVNQQIPANDMP